MSVLVHSAVNVAIHRVNYLAILLIPPIITSAVVLLVLGAHVLLWKLVDASLYAGPSEIAIPLHQPLGLLQRGPAVSLPCMVIRPF